MPQTNARADVNLLFGILAVQMDFVTRDQLIAAMHAWVLTKAKPLGQILLEHNALTADTRALLDALVQKHLALHNNDPQQSLAAVSSIGSVKKDLEQIADADVRASIMIMASPHAGESSGGGSDDPHATTGFGGAPTVPGQRFRILRPHAKGGLGEVFVAEDEELHREVALKEIQNRHADNPESRSRFLLEAEITGGLEHPGIVPVYGLGQYADGRPFYAMRFIRGDSLEDAIKRYHQDEPRPSGSGERTLELRKLLGRFIDVCQAMQYAHDRGVLHRDLKPGNIMLGKYGETLVVDWGLAKSGVRVQGSGVSKTEPDALAREAPLQPASSTGSETVAGSTIGTPAFMSPEQAAGRLDLLGPASDVYSLGATLYTLLTGKASIEERDIGVVLKKVQQGDFRKPREVKPHVAPALEAICLKAMALEPSQRYGSPQDLANDIEHFLADEPVAAWREPLSVRAGRWARKHKPLVSGVAAALVVGLVALTTGAIWYQHNQSETARKEALAEAETQRKDALAEAETLRKDALANAEAERKRLLAEATIRNTLDQAEKPRRDLHAILAKPGGVFGLLNEPARWEAYIQTAQNSLKAAQDMLASVEGGADPGLAERAAKLQELLDRDEADRVLAEKLEKIRLDRSTIVDGKFDYLGAAERYPDAFAKANLGILNDPPAAVVARLAASPIKEQLLAALDHWAHVGFLLGQQGLPEKLLEIGRLAAPDPAWGDRLRRIEAWRDQRSLTKVVKGAPAAGLSAPQLQMMGYFLAHDKSARILWLRQAQAQYPADFWLNFDLGHALSDFDPAEATGFYRVALGVRPKSSAAYNNLGFALHNQKKLPEAIAAYRKAIEISPKFAMAYNNLGIALHDQKKLPEAIAAYRKAFEIDPKFATAYYNLGLALCYQKKRPEGIVAFRKAIEIDPKFSFAYNNLGVALREQKKLPEAVAAFHKAIEINPKNVEAYNNLGLALGDQKDLPAAIAAYHKAIEIDPKYADAHGGLGNALFLDGRFADGAAALQKAVDLLPSSAPFRATCVSRLKQCRQLQALADRALAALDGTDSATPGELLQMGSMCQEYQKRFGTAVLLYRQAFKAQPALADDMAKPHRYNAACAAALAGTSGDAKDQPGLRRQARDWLQADLDVYAKQVNNGKAASILQTEVRLAHWLADPDLAGVRDAKALAAVPEAERSAWTKLWADVEQLRKQIRGLFTETTFKGTLTDKTPQQVHEMKFEAGKLYVIDMKSKELDSYLKLHDPAGKLVAENDDIAPDNLDSRIIYTPKETGVYRITAMSFQDAGVGAYTITVREFAAKKN